MVSCWPLIQPPRWRTIPCWLSATIYSLYSHLLSIFGGRLLHPQPEDASCSGVKLQHIFVCLCVYCCMRSLSAICKRRYFVRPPKQMRKCHSLRSLLESMVEADRLLLTQQCYDGALRISLSRT